MAISDNVVRVFNKRTRIIYTVASRNIDLHGIFPKFAGFQSQAKAEGYRNRGLWASRSGAERVVRKNRRLICASPQMKADLCVSADASLEWCTTQDRG